MKHQNSDVLCHADYPRASDRTKTATIAPSLRDTGSTAHKRERNRLTGGPDRSHPGRRTHADTPGRGATQPHGPGPPSSRPTNTCWHSQARRHPTPRARPAVIQACEHPRAPQIARPHTPWGGLTCIHACGGQHVAALDSSSCAQPRDPVPGSSPSRGVLDPATTRRMTKARQHRKAKARKRRKAKARQRRKAKARQRRKATSGIRGGGPAWISRRALHTATRYAVA